MPGLYERWSSTVDSGVVVFPSRAFLLHAGDKLLARRAAGSQNLCFAQSADLLLDGLSLPALKKMAVNCGFSFSDVQGATNSRQLAERIMAQAGAQFRGEGEAEHQPRAVFDPPYSAADEPFDARFVVETLAKQLVKHHLDNNEPLYLTKGDIARLHADMDSAGHEQVDIIDLLRGTFELGIERKLAGETGRRVHFGRPDERVFRKDRAPNDP